jgi:hypothetical protein
MQRLLLACRRDLDLARPGPTGPRGKRFSKHDAARRKNLWNKVPIRSYGVLLGSVFCRSTLKHERLSGDGRPDGGRNANLV